MNTPVVQGIVRARGKVARTSVDDEGAFIKLEKPDVEPKDGYFRLNQSDANYHAMYSLALAAAINRYVLQIRTKGDISPFRHAEVSYLVVDWTEAA
jgi:hypothetical protein